MMTSQCVLVGAGEFGRELICWAMDASKEGGLPKLRGFIDDDPHSLDRFQYGLKWLGPVDGFSPHEGDRLLMSLADPRIKRQVSEALRGRGAKFANLVHPSAVIARSAKLGEGVVVCPQSLISADAQVGDFVTINVLSSVGHDVLIGPYSTLSAHVDITGGVIVEEGVYFGTGAKVIPKLRIGKYAKIGAGATVIRSVPEGKTMYAPAAKRL